MFAPIVSKFITVTFPESDFSDCWISLLSLVKDHESFSAVHFLLWSGGWCGSNICVNAKRTGVQFNRTKTNVFRQTRVCVLVLMNLGKGIDRHLHPPPTSVVFIGVQLNNLRIPSSLKLWQKIICCSFTFLLLLFHVSILLEGAPQVSFLIPLQPNHPCSPLYKRLVQKSKKIDKRLDACVL